MRAPRCASMVSATFGVSAGTSRDARRCLLVLLERVEAIAPAFPVDKHGEASLGLARSLLERRKIKLAAAPWSTRRDELPSRRALLLGLEQALLLDDAARHVGKLEVALARGQLQAAERVLLGEVERRHKESLGPLDELAVFQRLLCAIDLRLQLLELELAGG